MNSSDAAAFAASRAIKSGEWDRHLRTLAAAIRMRLIDIDKLLQDEARNGR